MASLRLLSILTIVLLFHSGCNFYFGTFSSSPRLSRAANAEKLREEGKCEEAIEEYLAHIDSRLKEPSRPKDENPYFYYLLIGDCYLQMGNVEQAKESYLVARDQEVNPALVNERVRRLGHWF